MASLTAMELLNAIPIRTFNLFDSIRTAYDSIYDVMTCIHIVASFLSYSFVYLLLILAGAIV